MPFLVCPDRDLVRWYVVHGVNPAALGFVAAGLLV
jgi:hypothetical protein